MARDFAAALREAIDAWSRADARRSRASVLARLRVTRGARRRAAARAGRAGRAHPLVAGGAGVAMAALAVFALCSARRVARRCRGWLDHLRLRVVARSPDLLLRARRALDVTRALHARDGGPGNPEARRRGLCARRGVRVASGKVGSSSTRAHEAPRRVAVSQGEIHITGTRFTVEERGAAGHVTLHEGGIEFVAPGREPVRLLPGQALAWPLLDEVSLDQLPDAAAAPVASVALPAPALPMATLSSPTAQPAAPWRALPSRHRAHRGAAQPGRYPSRCAGRAHAVQRITRGASLRARLSSHLALLDRDKDARMARPRMRYQNGRYSGGGAGAAAGLQLSRRAGVVALPLPLQSANRRCGRRAQRAPRTAMGTRELLRDCDERSSAPCDSQPVARTHVARGRPSGGA